MNVGDLIGPDGVLPALRCGDKIQLLSDLAHRAAKPLAIDAQTILDALHGREALGSTGVGQGVALPHARIAGMRQLFGLFARLERPIDFDAIDQRPVDLVFLLLVPDKPGNEGLTALATVARQLRDSNLANRLRTATDRTELYQALVTPSPAAAGPNSR